jgi:hypothetical protein
MFSSLNRPFYYLSLALLLTSLTSCNAGSKADDRVREQGNREPRTCIPEKSLLSPGIVGGQPLKPTDLDAKTVVMLNIEDSEGLHICTASPISPNVLLTAAHCIEGDVENAFVTLYTSLACESGFDSRVNTAEVAEFVVHEDFDLALSETSPSEMKGDVALVFLKKNLPFGYPIYKIANPVQVTFENQIYFYGYGAVGYEKKGSGILRKTQLPRSSFTILEDEKKVSVDQSKGTGICTGDSGGPGLVQIDGELQILGINSYVARNLAKEDLCQGKSSLVLAESYRAWIENKLAQHGQILR